VSKLMLVVDIGRTVVSATVSRYAYSGRRSYTRAYW